MKKRNLLGAVVALIFAQSVIVPPVLLAQTPANRDEVYAAIRKEENDNSKIMHTLHILTDLYGPRLTGSPNHVNSVKWIMRELQSWGFENTAMEGWEFGH